jgi:p-hydroxybenzoate 3-monooxygenase
MTQTLHRFPDENLFDYKRQISDLGYIAGFKAAMTSLAENYVGLPIDIVF